MPEARAATAEYRITAPLIDGFRGPFSADARSHSKMRHNAVAIGVRYLAMPAQSCRPRLDDFAAICPPAANARSRPGVSWLFPNAMTMFASCVMTAESAGLFSKTAPLHRLVVSHQLHPASDSPSATWQCSSISPLACTFECRPHLWINPWFAHCVKFDVFYRGCRLSFSFSAINAECDAMQILSYALIHQLSAVKISSAMRCRTNSPKTPTAN